MAAEEGIASWYGPDFHGKPTASGELYDQSALTAAHKSLPFGALVRITVLDTSRSVTVRINDRGPFVDGRVIDLSRAAAEELGITGRGLARVRIDIVSLPAETAKILPKSGTVIIQIAAYSKEENARRLVKTLADKGFVASIEAAPKGIFRVIIDSVQKSALADTQRKLNNLGYTSLLVRGDGAP